MDAYNRPGKRERAEQRKRFPLPNPQDKTDRKTGTGAEKVKGALCSAFGQLIA